MHKFGDETEITRFVSAELDDVDPGRYTVIFKVTATRLEEAITPEDAILSYALNRKDKLLTVGRRFDYAQTKGNLRATEKSMHRVERQAKREAYQDGERVKRWKKMNERGRA